ncbi:MAG: hypothetical protein LBE84_02500, partial [Planctomycetota bacterium]|nr:hypothetical protein [Planctomycetota bacterium]
IGVSAGYSWNFSGGIGLDLEGYAWRPWDESYDTIIQDGRQHGLAAGLTLPVDRRLTFVAGVDIEWLELGPRAAAGRQSAGHQGGWNVRGNYVIWRRDGALMGYGFRDETLWNEQLIPVELGIFADMNWRRYVAPEDFTVIAPTRKSLQQRVGLFYYQAITPHLGFNSEAYLGRDPRRGIGPGKIYGVNLRLTAAVNSHFRFWTGWGYEKNRNDLTAGGGDAGGSNPASVWSFGLNCNF